MDAAKLWIGLAILSRVITAQQTRGNPTFAACLDQDYPVEIAYVVPNAVGPSECASACFTKKYNYIYSYYQGSTSSCLCSSKGPDVTDYQTGTDSEGSCQQFQYASYVTSSTFTFGGCYAGIVGSSLGSEASTLEECFQAFGSGSPEKMFKPAYNNGGTIVGACEVRGGNGAISGTGPITCDHDNAWYFYSHVGGEYVGGPSNYVKKRKRERLEREQGRIMARCPVDTTPCNINGLSRKDEAFEVGDIRFFRLFMLRQSTMGVLSVLTGPAPNCPDSSQCIDVRSEVESCGGCVTGVFGLYDYLSAGRGVDCTALPGVAMGGVTCLQGQCVPTMCKTGFALIGDECLEVHLDRR